MKPKLLLGIGILLLIFCSLAVWQNYRRSAATNSLQNQQFASLRQEPFPPQFPDKALFLSPIRRQKGQPSGKLVTGITVPHHLLASDLIAQAFNFASAGSYSQILLFSPDHFNSGETNVSVSARNFSTVFGVLRTDSRAAAELQQLPFVRAQDFFYREHGIGGELPFIKYYFPNAKIIALTFKESTPKNQLAQVVDALKNILDKNSLVIQSTDFSHYLTPENAAAKDRETLKALQTGNADGLFILNQPDNTDSIASQYVQTRLQREFYGSEMQILAHKNSQDYANVKITSTTSYIVQAFTKDK